MNFCSPTSFLSASRGIEIVAAVIGLGGGFLYGPTLTLVFGLDAKMAIGTSLAAMIFASISTSFWYRRPGITLYRVARFLLIPGMAFSVIWSYLTTIVDVRILVTIFCVMFVFVSMEMLVQWFRFLRESLSPSFVLRTLVHPQETQPVGRIYYLHIVCGGTVGGLLIGIAGTSVGAVFVSTLATAGILLHYAVATSMLPIIMVSITGAVAHAGLGHLYLPFLAVYGASAALWAFIGANLAPDIKGSQIKYVFGIAILIIASIMMYEKVRFP